MGINFDIKRTWGPTPIYPLVKAYKRPKEQKDFIVIAGPCSIESHEQMETICEQLKMRTNVTYLRGGVYRAGTYPSIEGYGIRVDKLELFNAVAHQYGFKTIVECLDVRDLDLVSIHADAIQIGARHMQDYGLLSTVSKFPRTVTLKRGTGQQLDEFLGACEYLLKGICKPMLIERGSSTYHNHVRWELSTSIIAAIKAMGIDVPIIVDASHGSGRRDLVRPLTMAGVAAGADGMLVETHPDPDKSLSDSEQAYSSWHVHSLIEDARELHARVRNSAYA